MQLEKEQVAVLAERLSALLDEVVARLGDAAAAPGEPAVDTEPLSTPVEEEFRVGTMGLGWDVESRAIVVELLAVTEQEVDESMVLDDTEEGPDAVRVFLSLGAGPGLRRPRRTGDLGGPPAVPAVQGAVGAQGAHLPTAEWLPSSG